MQWITAENAMRKKQPELFGAAGDIAVIGVMLDADCLVNADGLEMRYIVIPFTFRH